MFLNHKRRRMERVFLEKSIVFAKDALFLSLFYQILEQIQIMPKLVEGKENKLCKMAK